MAINCSRAWGSREEPLALSGKATFRNCMELDPKLSIFLKNKRKRKDN